MMTNAYEREICPECHGVKKIALREQFTPCTCLPTDPKPSKAACPKCGHAAHAEKCLVVHRHTKPGTDYYCLCEAAAQEEAAEPRADGWLELVEQFRRCRANNWAVSLTKRQVEIALAMLETAMLSRIPAADEPCPVTPQDCREIADYLFAFGTTAADKRLRELAAWIERQGRA